MYSKFEKPLISASIYYYDFDYDIRVSQKVCCILEEYGMFPPEKINADKLTNQKFIVSDYKTKDIFVQAYNEKDVFGVDMASGDSRKTEDFWQISWGFTFYKNSKIPIASPTFKPWNVLTVQSTYGRLKNDNTYDSFINCIKELIIAISPFYASIDDLNNHSQLLNSTKERHFIPDRIQEIYWGNYWGSTFCEKYADLLSQNQQISMIPLSNGLFFTLTNNVFDFEDKQTKRLRQELKNNLGIENSPLTLKRVFGNNWWL